MNIPEILKYTSPAHDRVLKACNARITMSHRAMSERYPAWKRSDEDFRAYTPETTDDKRRKSERDSGVQHYTTITIPMTYAMALTAHTYWSAVFFGRKNVFQLDIRKGEVQQSVDPMESLLDYQYNVGGLNVPMMIWLMDPLRYGFGILRTYWDRESRRVARMVEKSVIDPETGIAIPGRTEIEKVTEEIPGYRGNRAYNVRPYYFFPDTRVPLVDFQKGEFCADSTYKNVQALLTDAGYFNKTALKGIHSERGGTYAMEEDGSPQIQLPDRTTPIDSDEKLSDQGSVRIDNITVKIIPKDWGLGDEDLPEKWTFEIAEKKVIVSAEPFGHLHDEFPYDILMYEVEGYALDARGMMEIGRDLNLTTSWLLNSHMFNVRRALNDQMIVDPSKIVMRDLTDGGPGKNIRLKPSAYGSDVRGALAQLPIQDVTRSNVQDTQIVRELLQSILGVNDNVMGTLDPGGRKTATEVRTASTFSISRLKTIAEFFSMTGFSPLARKLVQNTQQFYFAEASQENQPLEVFRIVGENAQGLAGVDVTPASIAGFYDFTPVDGTLPVDRLAQANLWKEMIQILAQTGGYNLEEMLNMVAQLSGIRGMKRFKLQVLPDAQVAQQKQAGNLAPMGGTNGPPR